MSQYPIALLGGFRARWDSIEQAGPGGWVPVIVDRHDFSAYMLQGSRN